MAQPSTLNEISQLILNKERELHQFHDLRCGQLEALVEERDQLLIESSRRFEKLKDDFEYNLSLIQARDVEIERLEHELRMCVQENDAAKTDRRNLTLQLEAARTRESDAMKKAELDRINNKVSPYFCSHILRASAFVNAPSLLLVIPNLTFVFSACSTS